MYKSRSHVWTERLWALAVWLAIGFVALLVLGPAAVIMRLMKDEFMDGELEKKELEILLGTGITGEYIVANRCRVHYLACKNQRKHAIILVHGAFGSSLTFLDLMRSLSEEYDVYAIDLPGFGRSPCVKIPDAQDHVAFYGELIAAFMDALDIQTAVIGGHSFGGYVAVQFAKNHIRYASKGVVLFNPVGIFPTGSDTGMVLSTLFGSGVLQMARWYGTNRRMMACLPHHAAYWYLLLADKSNDSTEILSGYMEISAVRSRWKKPVIGDLCNLPCRVMLVYGMVDDISPAHQGAMIHRMNPSFRLVMVPFAGHDPFYGMANATFIARAMVETFILAKVMNRRDTTTTREINLDFSKYESSFSTDQTRETIKQLYRDLN